MPETVLEFNDENDLQLFIDQINSIIRKRIEKRTLFYKRKEKENRGRPRSRDFIITKDEDRYKLTEL